MAVSQTDNQIVATITSTIEVFGKMGLPGFVDILKNIFIEIEKVAANMLATMQKTLQKNFIELINCAIKATKYLVEGKLQEASKEAMKALNLLTPILEILSLIPPLALITGVLLALIYFCDNKKLLAIGALLGVLFVGIKWLMKIKSLSKVSASFSKVLNSANKLKQANPNAKAIPASQLKSSIKNAKNPVSPRTDSNISIKSTSSYSVKTTNTPLSTPKQASVQNNPLSTNQKTSTQGPMDTKFGDLTINNRNVQPKTEISSKIEHSNQNINVESNPKINKCTLSNESTESVQIDSLLNKEGSNGLSSGSKYFGNVGDKAVNIADDVPTFDSNKLLGINTNNTGNVGLSGLLDNGLANTNNSIRNLHTYTPNSMMEAQIEVQKYQMLGKVHQSTPKPNFGI